MCLVIDTISIVVRVYDSTPRGNMFKLNKGRAKYDLRKFYFTNRVVNAWNSLPDHVVLSETILTLLNHDFIDFGNIKI